MVEPETLWDWMEARRKALKVPPAVLMHPDTRRKIRRGELVRSDVYDNVDDKLRFVPGDAERAARHGIPPRYLEHQGSDAAIRRLTVMRTLSDATSAVADVPDDVLEKTEALAMEILKRLRGDKS